MVIKTRARSGADKLERRMQILETTLQLWGHTDYAKLTMSQVAAALNLAKGTLYLYFPSKEELFLAIYIQLLDEWFDAIELGVEDIVHPTAPALATLLVETLVAKPDLTRLMPLAATSLERNASVEAVREYKGWMVKRFARFGDQIEERVPGFPPGTGPEALTYFLALAAGLGPMGAPADRLKEVFDDPEYSKVRVHFAADLKSGFSAILVGLQHKFR